MCHPQSMLLLMLCSQKVRSDTLTESAWVHYAWGGTARYAITYELLAFFVARTEQCINS